MDYDVKQQPKKKTRKSVRSATAVDNSEYVFFHGRNYSNCLEYVKDYASEKKLTITFVELKNDELPQPLFEAVGLDWQVWRKNYGVILKHYWVNDLLDKKVVVWDNTTVDAPEGFTRLYRAIPPNDLPKNPSTNGKVKSFVKKVLPPNAKTTND